MTEEEVFTPNDYFLYVIDMKDCPPSRIVWAPNDDYMLRMLEFKPPRDLRHIMDVKRVARVAHDGEIKDTSVQVVWNYQTDGRYSRFDPSVACHVCGKDYDNCNAAQIYACIYQVATDGITGHDYDERMNTLALAGGKNK